MANTPISFDVGADSYTPTVNDIYAMVEKIAKQTIHSVNTFNPLEVFDKGEIQNGTTIEESVLKLLAEYDYDKTAVDAMKAADPTFITKYFGTWNEKQFETTVREDDIRAVLLGEKPVEEIAAKVVGNLSESNTHRNYKNMKGILSKFSTDKLAIAEPATIEEFLTLVRNTVDDFTFVNGNNVEDGLETRARRADIQIIMPYTLKNKIGVETLSHLINKEDAEIKISIIPIDTTDNKVYIVDKNAILHYKRVSEVTSQYNAKARLTNYFYTNIDLYGYCPLFKMAWIDVSTIMTPAQDGTL